MATLMKIEVAAGNTVKCAETGRWVAAGGEAFVPPELLEAKPHLAHMPTPTSVKPMTIRDRLVAAREILEGVPPTEILEMAKAAAAKAKGGEKADDKPPKKSGAKKADDKGSE